VDPEEGIVIATDPGVALVTVGGKTFTVEILPDDVLARHLSALQDTARGYAEQDRAPRTRETYAWAWERFVTWCVRRRFNPLPAAAGTVCLFASAAVRDGIEASQAPTKGSPRLVKPIGVRTLEVYLAAIADGHRRAGLAAPSYDPDTERVLDGIARTCGKPPVQKGALSEDQLAEILAALPASLTGLRDRAILLTAYASGGRRRSEVVSMEVEHLSARPDGYLWTIPKSKLDQYSKGFVAGITRGTMGPLPSAAITLDSWLTSAKITKGPVFRPITRYGTLRDEALSDRAVAELVKVCVERVGLNPASFSGHSLRASFVTNSIKAGRDLAWIKERTGHQSTDTLIKYVRSLGLLEG